MSTDVQTADFGDLEKTTGCHSESACLAIFAQQENPRLPM
jgi:hypothetical protein